MLYDRAACQQQDDASDQGHEAAEDIPRAATYDGGEDQDKNETEHGQILSTSLVRELTR